MKVKLTAQSIILHSILLVILIAITAPMALSEMTLNDNVNIEGEMFLEGDGGGITYPDGTRQTTAATSYSWDKYFLFAEDRYVLVLGNTAVLDRETGLVWQRETTDSTWLWRDAVILAAQHGSYSRRGWRLPTVEELSSLGNLARLTSVEDHPFLNVKSDLYWTITKCEFDENLVYAVDNNTGSVSLRDLGEDETHYIRAVRSAR